MTTDTTVLSYWWNWRFLTCAIFLVTTIALAAILIWKYEGCKKSSRGRRENQHESVGSLYEDEAWRTSLKVIHPAWLLAYRIVAFIVLLSLIITNFALSGVGILYFYTQWTFCLVTIYFGLGSSLSIYGCYNYHNRVGEDAGDHVRDEEQGTYVAPTLGEDADTSNMSKSFNDGESPSRKAAGVYVYIFQVIYQMCGGTVVLTDVVFWLILYPFLTSKSYKLNFMMVSMHSVNVVFLLGETILNSLRFPMFRISYFVLWTGIFVIFQWIIHACKNMWWPYPFLDLSSSYAPLWYLGVGVMHIPCYGVFALIIKMKQLCFSRSFPESSQGEK
ncbi:uncharacterized protein LOC126789823 [Argentina anserina]|uniref:uncharacterized protein LOC126789823 n=1 Tax=Argentina anserina TaxID=57926 RepID=UPI002176459D|nr:uncharacterized protein LOC126789823 [Potentilla anserina]XP_050371839.1 uncharacterized protein LOC126789823 [Potentilla anserina]